jgi:hypothetical protein
MNNTHIEDTGKIHEKGKTTSSYVTRDIIDKNGGKFCKHNKITRFLYIKYKYTKRFDFTQLNNYNNNTTSWVNVRY